MDNKFKKLFLSHPSNIMLAVVVLLFSFVLVTASRNIPSQAANSYEAAIDTADCSHITGWASPKAGWPTAPIKVCFDLRDSSNNTLFGSGAASIRCTLAEQSGNRYDFAFSGLSGTGFKVVVHYLQKDAEGFYSEVGSENRSFSCQSSCQPSCGDISSRCSTETWSNGCGGTCTGTKNCQVACTPNCGNTSTRCTTETWSDGCSGFCHGTKNCSPMCIPNCGDTSSRCTTETWSNGCSGMCYGTKNCQASTKLPNWTSCNEDGQCESNRCGCNGSTVKQCLPNADYPKTCTTGGTQANWTNCSEDNQCQSNRCGCNGGSVKQCLPNADYPKECTAGCQASCGETSDKCTTESWDDGCGGKCYGSKICPAPPPMCIINCSGAAERCNTESWDDSCGGKCFGTKNCQAQSTFEPYQMKVLSIVYIPTTGENGELVDLSITGPVGGTTVNELRDFVQKNNEAKVFGLTEGSRYHAYKDSSAKPSLQYSVIDNKEVLEKMPQGLPLNNPQQSHRPNYRQILEKFNICDYVDNQGVKEVWVWGYHYGDIEPAESNMSMGTNIRGVWNHGTYGDVSNSEQTDDIPICKKTYVSYGFNYQRNVTYEDHTHQIERFMPFADPQLWNLLFVGTQGTKESYYRCGWTHYPPNVMEYASNHDYDWKNPAQVQSDCEDWKPDGSGEKKTIDCSTWNTYFRNPRWPDAYNTACPDDEGSSFKIWWMQNIPGYGNNIPYKGQYLKNWWDFVGDFDNAIKDRKLYGPKTVTVNAELKTASGADVSSETLSSAYGIASEILNNSQIGMNLNKQPSDEELGQMYDSLRQKGILSAQSDRNSFVINGRGAGNATIAVGQAFAQEYLLADTGNSVIEEINRRAETFAADTGTFIVGKGSGGSGGGGGTLNNSGDGTPQTELEATSGGIGSLFASMAALNPSKQASLTDFIGAIIRLLMLLAGIIAVIFIILGGYRYITSAGNQENSKAAIKSITNAVIGLIIVIAAWLVINLVLDAVSGKYTSVKPAQTNTQAEETSGE